MIQRHNRLLTTLIVLATLVSAEAQTTSEVPQLVLNIIVDQLRTDYLEAFRPLYGQEGLNRLMKEGRAYMCAEYPFASPDRASSVACLMTGATPYENGIVGNKWLNRQTLQPTYCVDDPEYEGIQTADRTSPRQLVVSTIGDELKVATEGRSLVFSLGSHRDAVVMAAGHAADAAVWIDDLSGNWAGSSYYGEFPDWVIDYVQENRLSKQIGKMEWEPLSTEIGSFSYFGSIFEEKPFRHKFSGNKKYTSFKTSALGNDEVIKLATYALENTTLGTDSITDMLSVELYAGTFNHEDPKLYERELQDTYARLDQQVATLIAQAEKKVGKERVLVVLTSTGYTDAEKVQDLSKYRIPSGTFSITKAQLLLNMYLIAVYGEGQYVDAALENELYLNRKLIESKSLNLVEVMERSSSFLMQLAGVRDVFTIHRLNMGGGTPMINKLRNSQNPRCSGDILIQVSPGWVLVNENTNEQILSRESYMGFPLFLMGCGVEAKTVPLPMEITLVAPTLSQAMRIRAPNGCSSPPLNF